MKFKIDCKGLIIKELASITGISKRTIDTYLSNRAVIPNAEIAVKLARALDTTVEYLVTGCDSTVSPQFSQGEYDAYHRRQKLISYLDSLPDDALDVVSIVLREVARKYGGNQQPAP